MPPANERDAQEALAALERLLRHDVISLEEARLAARLITDDEDIEFPPPAAPAAEPTGGEATPPPSP